MEFATKLCMNGSSISQEDVRELGAHRWTGEIVLG